jgi:hypothetical protein
MSPGEFPQCLLRLHLTSEIRLLLQFSLIYDWGTILYSLDLLGNEAILDLFF